MQPIRAYFDRIRTRLLAALGMLVAGTVFVWAAGAWTLDRFSDRVSTQMEELYTSMDLGTQLEAAVLGQIAEGEHYFAAGAGASASEFARLGSQVHDLRSRLSKLAGLHDQEHLAVARIEDLHSQVEVRYAVAHAHQDLGRPALAMAQVDGLAPVVRELKSVIRQLSAGEATKVTQAATEARISAVRRQFMLAGLLALSTIFGVILVLRTVEAINRPLRRLVAAADQFGAGDLNVRVEGKMPQELSVLAHAFENMADRIRLVVGETVSTAEQIGASASDLSSISEEVAASSGEVSTAMVGITSGAEEQATGLREVDVALDEMRHRADEISQVSAQVLELSAQIRGLADGKRRDISRALSMLLEVREVVNSSSHEVSELVDSMEKINDFVEMIQGIARQTNLLALNAAIEAARAGEHGRGFAVVAEEVRKLAVSSARAADEVAGTIKVIRKELADVVVTIDQGTTRVGGVEEASRGAEAAFEEIIGAVEQVRSASGLVARVADENRAAFGSVEVRLRGVGTTAQSHAASAQQVSAAAQEQSAATEEMSAASVELLHAAERLKQLVSPFRV